MLKLSCPSLRSPWLRAPILYRGQKKFRYWDFLIRSFKFLDRRLVSFWCIPVYYAWLFFVPLHNFCSIWNIFHSCFHAKKNKINNSRSTNASLIWSHFCSFVKYFVPIRLSYWVYWTKSKFWWISDRWHTDRLPQKSSLASEFVSSQSWKH